MFSSRETLRFSRNKIHRSPRDQALSGNFAFGSSPIWKTELKSMKSAHRSLPKCAFSSRVATLPPVTLVCINDQQDCFNVMYPKMLFE